MARKYDNQTLRLLASLARGPYEEARVMLVEEPGKEPKVDIRLWWLARDGAEEWRPTRHGVRFLLSALPKLISTLRLAHEEFGRARAPVEDKEAPFS